MNASQARQIPITDLLLAVGVSPQVNNGREVWYRSPFRAETKSSFVVHLAKNAYFDHGEGKGGNALDLALRLFNTDVSGALRRLSDMGPTLSPFSAPWSADNRMGDKYQGKTRKEAVGGLKIENRGIKVVPIERKELQDYLTHERKVDFQIAKRYLREAHFVNKGRSYYALAFPNDSGGFELRNRFYQGSTAPKYWTTFQNFDGHNDTLNVFEGFMDFLSALTYYRVARFKGDVVVLNSLSFAERVGKEVAGRYRTVNLFLDNDGAGVGALAHFGPNTVNQAARIYPKHKDFNDFLKSYKQQVLTK